MSKTATIRDEATAALAAVAQIDLTPINAKLRHDDPEFWTDEVIAQAELDYRRFLALNILRPATALSVNKTLDEYWHQHILDTRKYAADCDMVFGRFLHHYPYFGLEDEQEWQENLDLFAFTQDLWEEAFGVGLAGRPQLTLDKVVGGYSAEPDASPKRIYAFPESCKSSQHHCKKIVAPEFDPGPIEPLPEEPFPQAAPDEGRASR
ncbi:glycine-rich domain-containing protein [Nonomuraea purpurea]|uniref:Glycine-rich domain-containing protein n=1 Tax=Nonomuraea purpurea TaxID=1849276 RepID=A0ABV8G3M5_9ACTN